MNALVGEKIAIMADQPETTRRPIRGVVNREDAQVIVVDTPGVHRPRTLLGQRLNEIVKDTYQDVDVIGFTVPADEKLGPGDRFILEEIRAAKPKTPIVGIVTKLDKVPKDVVGSVCWRCTSIWGRTWSWCRCLRRTGCSWTCCWMCW